MTTLQFFLFLLIMAGGFALIFWTIRRAVGTQASSSQLDDVVNKVFGLTAQKIAEQSAQILRSEKDSIHVDLANKQVMMEKLVGSLQEELRSRQQELRLLEQDRTKKFSELATTLQEHRKLAEELRVSTEQLANVLSNNQQRGEWGERIIEDLLQANGLVEGVHYRRQTQLAQSSLRPDIVLLLPNERTVAVDVKFPYAEIQKMAKAETKELKDGHLRQFRSDLKQKIEKVAKYIDPSMHTLDYAILFVPNEMVFSFINQSFPDIVDEAMRRRVMIVSPFTFLIVARTVMESYRNFMVEDKMRDMLQFVAEFASEWGKYKDEFLKFGRSIETLRLGYESLTTTRTRQLDRKIASIDQTRILTAPIVQLSATPEQKNPDPAE